MPQECGTGGCGLDFFDANCFIGLPSRGLLRPVASAEELLAEMDRSAVSRALVWHVAQLDCGALTGNRLLADAVAGRADRLTGCWSILPSQTGEFPPPERLLEQMAQAGVRALRAWPAEHRFLLRREVVGPLLETMQERRIPLILSDPEALYWRERYDLLADFPRLVCILADTGIWGPDRWLRPLLERYPNVYVELSAYWVDGGIEDLVRSYGASRLLFGTGFPQYDHGGMMLALRHAEISPEQREEIAFGNLQRLLEEARL